MPDLFLQAKDFKYSCLSSSIISNVKFSAHLCLILFRCLPVLLHTDQFPTICISCV